MSARDAFSPPFLREIELAEQLIRSWTKLVNYVKRPWKLFAIFTLYILTRFSFLSSKSIIAYIKGAYKRFVLRKKGEKSGCYEPVRLTFGVNYHLATIEYLHRIAFPEEELEPISQNSMAINKLINEGDSLMTLTKRMADNCSIFYLKIGVQRFEVDGIKYISLIIPKDTLKFNIYRFAGIIGKNYDFEFSTNLYFASDSTSMIDVPLLIKKIGDVRFKKVAFSTSVRVMSNGYRREEAKVKTDRKKRTKAKDKNLLLPPSPISLPEDNSKLDTSEEEYEEETVRTAKWVTTWSQEMITGYTDLDNIIVPTSLRKKIIGEVERFGDLIHLGGEIPNRKSYLLYGPPGTGKTTLAISIGAVYGLPIYVIDNYKYMNQRNLREYIAECARNTPCVLLFEECEELLLNYEKMGIDKSTMTSILDGTLSPNQIFTVFTTNLDISAFDDVDPAIMRAGRIDRKYNFDITDKKELVRCISASAGVRFLPEQFYDDLVIGDVRECQFIRTIAQESSPQSDVSNEVRDEILTRFGVDAEMDIEEAFKN